MTAQEFHVSQFTNEIAKRPALNKTPSEWTELNSFLTLNSPNELRRSFQESRIGERFEKDFKPYLPADLVDRATNLFSVVLGLKEWRIKNGESGLQVPDADLIQKWVVDTIKPEELTLFTPHAYKDWGERLTENPIPHIAQANEWSAQKIAENFKGSTGQKRKLVDLGAGTGSTMLAIIKNLQENEIQFDIKGVELTPELANFARERTGKDIIVENALSWLEKQENGSLDGISAVYVIHRLSYQDQAKFKDLAFKKLKAGGYLALAAPTGRSKYNLDYLDVNEPEAIIAHFQPSVVNLAVELQNIGFTIPYSDKLKSVNSFEVESTQEGNLLDQGSRGYAIIALKL